MAGKKEVTPQEAYAAFLARMERYEQLEVLDQNWEEEKKRLRAAFHEDNYLECIQNIHTAQQGREYEYEHLLVYFTFRYFMRSYYDDNILNKAQFAVASILMIRDMDALRFLENGGIILRGGPGGSGKAVFKGSRTFRGKYGISGGGFPV